MKKIMMSPGKFVVGNGELKHIEDHVKAYGKKALLVAFHEDFSRIEIFLEKAKETTFIKTNFAGECTHQEIQRIKEIGSKESCEVVIGLGGGKAIDTAKYVAHTSGLPLIVVPTIASTDAPCSTLAVVYDENHTQIECRVFSRNPDVVLVDTGVIAKAPARFLAAGIGDAYATYYEARACMNSMSKNFADGLSTQAAYALSTLCKEVLLKDGAKAMDACRQHIVTQALENIVEANLLLSGIGFESVGLAAAHGLYVAATILPDVQKSMHGEIVAVGLLTQLVLENVSTEEFEATLSYYEKIGLPQSWEEVGIKEERDVKLRAIAKEACKEGSSLFNMAVPIDEEIVYYALKAVGDARTK